MLGIGDESVDTAKSDKREKLEGICPFDRRRGGPPFQNSFGRQGESPESTLTGDCHKMAKLKKGGLRSPNDSGRM